MSVMQEGDLVVVAYRDKKYLKRLETDKAFHGKGGILPFSSVIGSLWGARFGEYDVFSPTLEDIMMFGVRRETQIVFPKDAFFALSKLNIRPGGRVMEVGTGSGTMTLLLSRSVGPEGTIFSVEKEERHFKNAKKNVEKYREFENIQLHNMDIADFEGGPFDAAFVDLREPWLFMEKISSLLRGGAVAAFIVPTTNQVSEMLPVLKQKFGCVEVVEILFRTYKTIAARLRPEDRMIGHTGYLVFGRKLDEITELHGPIPDHLDEPQDTFDPTPATEGM
jgi:tRNA (adenine57-N1/adenine58-N1)-methyltransferase catalytic subunit